MRFPCVAILILVLASLHPSPFLLIRIARVPRRLPSTNTLHISAWWSQVHLSLALVFHEKYTRRWLAPPRTFPKQESIDGTSPRRLDRKINRCFGSIMDFIKSTRSKRRKSYELSCIFFYIDISESSTPKYCKGKI